MGKNEETYAKCPFYKWEEKQTLRCEGVSHAFDSKADRREFERMACKGDWKRCPFARLLAGKYDYQI